MLFLIIVGSAVVLVFVTAALSRRARGRVLARMRAEWGTRVDRDRNMDSIAKYHRSRAEHIGPSRSLDDRTWADLDLDGVFGVIDRTTSTLGRQALYHRLRTAPVADNLEAFEALVTRMCADAATRERTQLALACLQDPAGYDLWWLAQPGSVERQPWHIFFPVAALVMLAACAVVPIWPGAVLIVVAGAVINMIVRYATATRIGAVVASFRQLGPLIRTAEACRFLVGGAIEPITRALQDEVPQLGRLKMIGGWVNREPSAGIDLGGLLLEYLNVIFLLDVNAVYFGGRELNAKGAVLLRVIAAVGEIDAALAVASFRAGARAWTRPRLHDRTGLRLADIRHPLLDDAVPNSIELAPPHGVLVTGSNMSGKSTFIRTLGVNVVMAQTINTCLAAEYEAPVLRVRTCIGRADDLLAGKSYYLVEVEAVLSLVEASASGTPHLFLFDELFRGTNAVERIAAAEAVLTELIVRDSGFKPHVVVAATHDGELVDLLADSYAAYHFEDSLGPEGLTFEHRLRAGPATSRNAIQLLRLHGAPDGLVNRALARATALDKQRLESLRES